MPRWETWRESQKIPLNRYSDATSDFRVGVEPELEPRCSVGLSSLIPVEKY